MRILQRTAFAVALMSCAGCAHTISSGSEQATKGALRAASAKVQRIEPGALDPLADASARAVVTGVLSTLDDPAQQRQLAEVVSVSAAAALRGLAGADVDAAFGAMADLVASRTLAALARELAFDTPLRLGMNDATHALAGSAVAGARDELTTWWGCAGRDDQGCMERRLSALTRELTRGATQGVFDTLAIGLLVSSFIAGVLLTMIVVAVVLVVRRQRPRFRSHATSSVAPPRTPA